VTPAEQDSTPDRHPPIRVGHVPGVTLTKWLRRWAERYPAAQPTVTAVAEADQRAVLDADEVDVCFVRLPLPGDDLHLVVLYTEEAVVVVPRDHPASLFDSVSLSDLADETLLDPAEVPADPFDLVAGGAGLLLVPQSVARSRSRRDLVYRPVRDAEPTQVGLAWRRDHEHPATQDFVGVVRGRTENSSRGTAPPAPAPKARPQRPTPTVRRRPARRRGRRT
jgi:DNA-binding transcriptional LysR family regulator